MSNSVAVAVSVTLWSTNLEVKKLLVNQRWWTFHLLIVLVN